MSSHPDRTGGIWRGLLWLLLLALLAGQLWGLYLLVPGEGAPIFPGQDKLAHALLFGVPFALALWLGTRLMAVLILVHALVSEPLQGLLTTTRTADGLDLVADLIGIGVAGGAVLLLRARTRGGDESVVPGTVEVSS